jgi:DDE superfamily endonuclease
MLSAMAGVTGWNFYFRLFPGAIRSPQIIEFLSHLLRHVPGKLLIVWDGLPGHRSRATWEFIREQRGRLWVEFLPGTGSQNRSPEQCRCRRGEAEEVKRIHALTHWTGRRTSSNFTSGFRILL